MSKFYEIIRNIREAFNNDGDQGFKLCYKVITGDTEYSSLQSLKKYEITAEKNTLYFLEDPISQEISIIRTFEDDCFIEIDIYGEGSVNIYTSYEVGELLQLDADSEDDYVVTSLLYLMTFNRNYRNEDNLASVIRDMVMTYRNLHPLKKSMPKERFEKEIDIFYNFLIKLIK